MTPQQNGIIEWEFATLYNHVCAMLNNGKIEGMLKAKLWAEACNMVTLLSNITVTIKQTMSSYKLVHKKKLDLSLLKIVGM